MIRKILAGYDGSESAKRALEFAIDLAGKYGSQLHVVAVSRPPDFGTEVETEAIVEKSLRHFARILEPVQARLAAGPVSATCEVVVGHPAEQIVRYAEKHGIDHIVVGRRGHTLFERWLIGSVARQVIAYASCAVTVVNR
jgi:nucleotide-binding universal stress UspA family protein